MHNKDFRSTNGRCLLDQAWLNGFGVPAEDAIITLNEKFGFERVMPNEVNILSLARHYVGKGVFLRRAPVKYAPWRVDCSSFVVFLYEHFGVEVPRLAVDQFNFGQPIEVKDAHAGDLIFTSGNYGYHLTEYKLAVGHVGILTGEGTVIHANNQDVDPPIPAIDEMSIEEFMKGREFRGACRILPPPQDRLVFRVPPDREFTWSRELVWLFSTTLSW